LTVRRSVARTYYYSEAVKPRAMLMAKCRLDRFIFLSPTFHPLKALQNRCPRHRSVGVGDIGSSESGTPI
ncbi:MAG: hypothetical protein K2H92_10020, partial [Bacteroidaceae bacterium]|nr:hypothetical protein [Bacteroidaceae bacterium]